MFAELLRSSGAEVRIVDPAADAADGNSLRGDVTAIDEPLAAELRDADAVLLAVPEPVALSSVGAIGKLLRPGALLVDTLTVKSRIAQASRELSPDVEMVSVNPMFAPSLGMAGRPVAAVLLRTGPRSEELLRLMGSWGGRVVRMTADEHDRTTAAAQVLTHAAVLGFGLALPEIGVGIAELSAIAPPPHATLLALLSRISSGTPEVYWDAQEANPHGQEARSALAHGVRRLAELIESGDQEAFATALAQLSALYGDRLDHYRNLCADLFEVQRDSTRETA
jgi:prephenate dehydrogenase